MQTIAKALGILVVVLALSNVIEGQVGPTGTIRFSGPLRSVVEQDRKVQLEVGVFTSRMSVELDEHSTVTGSLGGRVSARSLVPGLFVEIQGYLLPDGRVRAEEVEIKVQAGALRMTGRIENIFQANGGTSILVNGAEFALDDRTVTVVPRNGITVAGGLADLSVGNDVDVTGTYLNETGSGPATSGLFHADRIIVSRTFRIQGVIRSRTPSIGDPTIIVVHGIVVTVTPETTIVSNGMNERNEAFMPRTTAVVSSIEDDAGDPCRNTPGSVHCPDTRPKDPAAAGELQLDAFVRIEGVVEDTGFSSRYTARGIQIEKPQQVRFQAIVESRTDTTVSLLVNGNVRTQVLLNSTTQVDGEIAAGRLVEVAGQFNPADLSIVCRRVKVLQ
jgi:hypothetical protein